MTSALISVGALLGASEIVSRQLRARERLRDCAGADSFAPSGAATTERQLDAISARLLSFFRQTANIRQTKRVNQKQRARDFSQALDLYGSPSWIRTSDTRINSPLLYQLSYRGMVEPRIVFGGGGAVKRARGWRR
jgi:hypothetical protein